MKKIVGFALFIGLLASCSKNEEVQLKLEEPLKLCFFGDGGTGTPDQLAVARLLERESCHAYFYLGDIVYPSGISSAKDPEIDSLFYSVYEPIFEKSPMFLMMGNHDYKGDMDAWIEVAKRHPNLKYPYHYYLARINGICFPVMNTTNEKLQQIVWLSQLDLSGCNKVILAGHHPAKSSGMHKKPYFPLNLFLNYAISFADIYIAGHDHHLSYEGLFRGVHQFVSGAAGQLRPLNKDLTEWGASRLGYLTLSEDDDSFRFDFWGLGNTGEKKRLHSEIIQYSSLAND